MIAIVTTGQLHVLGQAGADLVGCTDFENIGRMVFLAYKDVQSNMHDAGVHDGRHLC